MVSFEEFGAQIREKYQALLEASLAIPSLTEALFAKEPSTPLEKITRSLAMIVVSDFGALLLLAVSGYGVAAAKLSRTMFETSVNIAYLRRHPEEIDNFIDFHHIAAKRFYDHLVQFAPDEAAKLPKKDVDETIQKYEQIKGNYPDKRSWAVKSLPDRAEEVNSLPMYRLLYSTLSGLIHGDVRAVMTQTDPEMMTFDAPPSEKWIKEALLLGHNAAYRAAADYNEISGQHADAEIVAIGKGWNEAWG